MMFQMLIAIVALLVPVNIGNPENPVESPSAIEPPGTSDSEYPPLFNQPINAWLLGRGPEFFAGRYLGQPLQRDVPAYPLHAPQAPSSR
jgi:hypothetical protein